MRPKTRIPLTNDPAVVAPLRRYAMLLAARHGMEYPAFVDVVKRIDDHLDRLLQLEGYEKKSNFMHGKKRK